MNLKKVLSLALAGAMCLSLLAGCTGGAPNPTSTPAPASNPPAEQSEAPSQPAEPAELTGTLKVAMWDMTADPIFASVIDAFKDANPGVTIEPIDIPSADYGTKLSVMLNGGSDVDVFWVKDADTIYPIAKRGQMADMSSYITRDGLDLGIYNGQAEDFNIDGKQIGMPFRTDYYVLFYNKDIFDAAGVEYPSNDMTWTEFEELAKKVLSEKEVVIAVDLHEGEESAECWGCDLTYEYVKINGDYRT